MNQSPHKPVLLGQVLNFLSAKDNGVYLDCTFGAGGYSKAILDSADCNVIAIDRDPEAEKIAQGFKAQYGTRFEFIKGNFGQLDELIGTKMIDGIVMDLGVSSMQLDRAIRGFSFMQDGPLDMRMSGDGVSAADFINSAKEKDIADIIYKYSDERNSRRIARNIVIKRTQKSIQSTLELANIIRYSFPRVKMKTSKIDLATRSFQAIRIYINDELGELESALTEGVKLLKNKGRFIVVSFHSLEDKIIKEFFNDICGKVAGSSRYLPSNDSDKKMASFKFLNKKPVAPDEDEITDNIRSRSAKLRAVEKITDEIKITNERGLS